MDIQSKLPHAQMPSVTKDVSEPIKATGEYAEIKEKSKSQILTVGEKALLDSINKANKAVQGTPHEFKYKIHQSTGDVIVQILNKDTQEVIHEVPSEKFIELVEKLQELTVGTIIDEKR
ncbi:MULTISPECIES: flagellar protein FlaG [unclassified Paenibacillus]|uniref:flagellar protein FlaG n=1 Tax=unclassified Paenibacillus TaxID=185978 RepID=UPI0006F35FA8|nr:MULTISPECIES: flagellar protein FlaG [unclassified Paenibacillus]KQX63832.1 flagellar biosynthesis protein FlaG [Paenibacillus sp. Root444D2]KRF33999.1 flagellar biosynthesis protein FlaG [Paenibacillus sp. Soil787]